jgi:hypothetical protein
MYNISQFGIVTMNPPCTMNISKFKKKERKKEHWKEEKSIEHH